MTPKVDAENTAAVTAHASLERRLRDFDGTGYDKGRNVLWQSAWFATMNLIFMKWWLPAFLRPGILRIFGANVGQRVLIRHRVRIQWPWKLGIGDDCWIGEGVWLMNLEPITIEHDVCVSQEAFLCTGAHRPADPFFAFDNGPIAVRSGAWIGARALILRGAVVEAGQVVPAGTRVSRGAIPSVESPSGRGAT